MTIQRFQVIMPQLGANDDEAQIIEWLVKPGQEISKGQALVTLETSKATYDVESEENGYFWPIANTGETRPVQDVIGLILSENNTKIAEEDIKFFSLPQKPATEELASTLGTPQLTVKARKLLEEHKIDLAILPTDRIIRTTDIQDLIADKQITIVKPVPDALRRVVIYGASQGGLTVAECLHYMGNYEVIAFLDDTPEIIGNTFAGYPVWSGKDIELCASRNIGALITHIANRDFRVKLVNIADTAGLYLMNVIHPSAIVANSVNLGVGNLIKAGEGRLGAQRTGLARK